MSTLTNTFAVGDTVKYRNEQWAGAEPPPHDFFGWHHGRIERITKNPNGWVWYLMRMDDGTKTWMRRDYAERNLIYDRVAEEPPKPKPEP